MNGKGIKPNDHAQEQGILVVKKGSFFVAGKRVTIKGGEPFYTSLVENSEPQPYSPDGDYQAGQMYVQYTRIAHPVCPFPVCMIHGGGMTGAEWESTLDGRPGWEFHFLQNGFDVNVSDGVERGRSSWAKYPEINAGPPFFRNYEEAWRTFRLGEHYPEPYEGLRFDTDRFEYFVKQQVPRWTTSNRMVDAGYAAYLEGLKDGCILLAHSQGGLFALRAALEYPAHVKAIVLVESSSSLDVNTTDVSSLKDVPFLFVWGDFLGEKYTHENYSWVANFAYNGTMRNLHERILSSGGDSTWLELPDLGITGNSHAMMVEDNSYEVADMILDWLKSRV
jgi:hypothetical protein